MKTLISNIVNPIIHRLGSMAGVALAAQGVASSDITVISAGIVALAGVIVDLIVRKVL